MPMADSSPPIVVGIRQTSSDDEDEHRLRGAGVDRERLQGDDGHQEHDRQAGQQDVERNLVRRLLPFRAFDQRDHPIEKGVPGVGGHADLDPVRQHLRAAGHGRAVAAGLADHRRRFARDRRLVDRRHTLDDLAVGRDELAGLHHHHVVLAQRGGRHGLGLPAGGQPVRHRLGPGLAQRVGLRLASPFGHRLGQVGEQDRGPQPQR